MDMVLVNIAAESAVYGVGLPNSSMSQASRVEIWSWKTGVTNALYTWLSIEDVESGREEIPDPQLRAVPEVYLQSSQNGFEDSGTLGCME